MCVAQNTLPDGKFMDGIAVESKLASFPLESWHSGRITTQHIFAGVRAIPVVSHLRVAGLRRVIHRMFFGMAYDKVNFLPLCR